jgi:putative autotransporter adhesin-like protein
MDTISSAYRATFIKFECHLAKIKKMKTIGFILSSALLITAALHTSAQQTQTRQVSGFNAIASGGSFDVHIKLDGNESLKIQAEAKSSEVDIINDIETVVENGTLKIRNKDRHSWHHYDGRIDIYIEAKSLNALVNSGSGSMKVDGTILTGDFKVTLSGSGDISASIKSDDSHAVISGSGSIKLNGNADNASFVITGSGEMDCKNLKANSVTATVTGSGNIYVQAEKSIVAHITGSGGVIYSGSATNIISHTTGSGSVSRAD